MCICALVVRSRNTAVTFDVCTKGYMRAWAKKLNVSSKFQMNDENKIEEELLGLRRRDISNSKSNINDDIEVLSIDDGRVYQLNLGDNLTPSSSIQVRVGPLLTYVKITAALGNSYSTLGLCGTFDGNLRNEYMAMIITDKDKKLEATQTSTTTQVIESICPDENSQSTRKIPCSAFFNAWR